MSKYRWVNYSDASQTVKFYDVGILDDGTLHNPNGYPDETVRTAVLAADGRRKQRRSKAAKKAAATRALRQERNVHETAERIIGGMGTGPRRRCCICNRHLADAESIIRGIGAECWQGVLALLTEVR